MTPTASHRAADTIDSNRDAICSETVALHYERAPELRTRYSSRGHAACLEDCGYHLGYLIQSVDAAEPRLFSDYILWARTMLEAYAVPAEDLRLHLECLKDVLAKRLEEDELAVVDNITQRAMHVLLGDVPKPNSFVDSTTSTGALAQQYLELLLTGKRQDASTLILSAVDGDMHVREVYLSVFQPVQYEIGRLWQLNRISIAQEHYCTAATQLVMSQLYPRIFSMPRNGRTLVATCVGGELHELGIRMVSDFFEMAGWDSFYLGASTPTRSIIKAVVERQAHVLAISTTITRHIGQVSEIIRDIRASEASHVKILVGGYPFNLAPDLWRQIGADACASNALDAVAVADKLVLGHADD